MRRRRGDDHDEFFVAFVIVLSGGCKGVTSDWTIDFREQWAEEYACS